MKKKNKILSNIYTSIVYIFLYVPIIVLIVYAFNDSKSRNVWAGFTLDNFVNLFHNKMILKSVGITLILALLSSVLATFIGTLGAIGIYKMEKKYRRWMMRLTYLPVISPEIVTGVSLMLLFSFLRIKLGFVTLLLAHITFNLPYVILNVLPKLKQVNKSNYEAAQDLGCNEREAFFKVVIPEIMPGIISGFLMALTYSIDDFVISHFTSGPQSQTLPITIYSMTRRRINPQINALSAIIFIVVLLILVISNIHGSRKYKKANMR